MLATCLIISNEKKRRRSIKTIVGNKVFLTCYADYIVFCKLFPALFGLRNWKSANIVKKGLAPVVRTGLQVWQGKVGLDVVCGTDERRCNLYRFVYFLVQNID